MAQAEAPLKPMAAAETATSPKQVTIKEGAPTVMPEPAPGGAPAGIPMAQTEIPTEKTVDNAGALVPHEASRSAPTSPGAPTATKSGTDMSPGKKGSNLKAEAFADAHSKRVETEAQAYLESEIRKAEAHAERLSVSTILQHLIFHNFADSHGYLFTSSGYEARSTVKSWSSILGAVEKRVFNTLNLH